VAVHGVSARPVNFTVDGHFTVVVDAAFVMVRAAVLEVSKM